MPTSRRNMIVGLGALTVGGGAVFGSGAFSSTEAERGLEVEVIRGEDIAERAVDIQVDPDEFPNSNIEFFVDGESEQPGDLFPDDSDNTSVSILQNDVTIDFGSFLGDATTDFDEFFTIINNEGEESGGEMVVTLDSPDPVFNVEYDEVTVGEGQDDTADLSINTSEGGEDVVETLNIVIESSS